MMRDGLILTLLAAVLGGCVAGESADQRSEALRRRVSVEQDRARYGCAAETLGCRNTVPFAGTGFGR